MPDHDVLDPSQYEYYRVSNYRPKVGGWHNPTPEQVVRSLNKAHQLNRRLVRDKDRLEKVLRDGKQQILIMSLIVGPIVGIVGKAFLDWILK
jgi:hypothetical protein